MAITLRLNEARICAQLEARSVAALPELLSVVHLTFYPWVFIQKEYEWFSLLFNSCLFFFFTENLSCAVQKGEAAPDFWVEYKLFIISFSFFSLNKKKIKKIKVKLIKPTACHLTVIDFCCASSVSPSENTWLPERRCLMCCDALSLPFISLSNIHERPELFSSFILNILHIKKKKKKQQQTNHRVVLEQQVFLIPQQN